MIYERDPNEEIRDLRDFYYRVKLYFRNCRQRIWMRGQVLRKLEKLEIEWERERNNPAR